MQIYKKGTGEKYTPFNHFGMQTEVIFNPAGGCRQANITLSTVPKHCGADDEVHPNSDQIFYVLTGTMKVYADKKLLAVAEAGDAVFVGAGEVHAVVNQDEEDLSYLAITVPPLTKTH